MALASIVLPTPGTSSISRCPSATRATSARRISACLPRTTCSTLCLERVEVLGEGLPVLRAVRATPRRHLRSFGRALASVASHRTPGAQIGCPYYERRATPVGRVRTYEGSVSNGWKRAGPIGRTPRAAPSSQLQTWRSGRPLRRQDYTLVVLTSPERGPRRPGAATLPNMGRALVLNVSTRRSAVLSARRAVVLVLKEKADVVVSNGVVFR